jgi:hypothetical protein
MIVGSQQDIYKFPSRNANVAGANVGLCDVLVSEKNPTSPTLVPSRYWHSFQVITSWSCGSITIGILPTPFPLRFLGAGPIAKN